MSNKKMFPSRVKHYLNEKLRKYYENMYLECGVNGTFEVEYDSEENEIIIRCVEDSVTMYFSTQYLREEKESYYFDLWLENPNNN